MKFQVGFRAGHSIETALHRVLNDFLLAADCGQHTVLLLLICLWLLTIVFQLNILGISFY